MNSEMIDLAREAVACVPIEEWPAGSRFIGRHGAGDRIIHPYDGDCIDVHNEWINQTDEVWEDEDTGFPDGWLPDLTDPATIGCLLHLVREVWGDPKIYMTAHGSFWIPARPLGVLMNCDGPTEAAALVAALKAGSDK